MYRKLVIGLVVCLLAVTAANAGVVAYESFDGRAVGSSILGTMPTGGNIPWTGATWAIPTATGDLVVAAGQTGQGVQMQRLNGQNNQSQGFGNSSVTMQAGQTWTASTYYKSTTVSVPGSIQPGAGAFELDNRQDLWDMGGVREGWDSQPNHAYELIDFGGASIGTGITPTGGWDLLELVLHINPTETGYGAGYELQGTVDLYITPAGGVRTLGASSAAGPFGKDTPLLAYIDSSWAGAPYMEQTCYFDEITISSVPEPATMSLLGLGLLGLLRRKR
jgi:hypothetical protein